MFIKDTDIQTTVTYPEIYENLFKYPEICKKHSSINKDDNRTQIPIIWGYTDPLQPLSYNIYSSFRISDVYKR